MILFAFLLAITFVLFLRVYKIVLIEKNVGNVDSFDVKSSTATGYFISKELSLFNFFRKFHLKFAFSTVCIASILLFNISANVSIWPNVKGLSMDDKKNSIAFRNFRGSSCINEFTALKPALETAKLNGYNGKDIIGIFGEPSLTNSTRTIFQYNLLPGTLGCKGIIVFENDKVVSYSIEGCN